jgi:hypothetical protein
LVQAGLGHKEGPNGGRVVLGGSGVQKRSKKAGRGEGGGSEEHQQHDRERGASPIHRRYPYTLHTVPFAITWGDQ